MYASHLNAGFERWLFEKVPANIVETPFPTSTLQSFDKIFASQWLDAQTLVTASKDNKVRHQTRKRNISLRRLSQTTFFQLTVWDLSKRAPTPQLIALPSGSETQVAEQCGIHGIAINNQNSLLGACGGASSCPERYCWF